jgi:hypothetical protein
MTAPAVVIRLELESSPRVCYDVMSESEQRRLSDWINCKPELLEIVRAVDGLQALGREPHDLDAT